MEQSGDVLEPFGEPCLFVVESVEISEGEGLVAEFHVLVRAEVD